MVQLLLVALCAGKRTVWKDLQLHFLSLLCIALLLFASCGSTMAQSWNQIPNSGSVVSVTALPNGSLLGVGTDKLLWTRSTLNSEWVQVPNSGHVSSVAVMPDGSILGAGMNTALWTRATLTGDWKQVPNSGSVIGVAVMRDGTIIGVGTDKQLYTRATLTSDWKQVANSGAVISVAVMGDGSIIGVGTDNYLWTRSTLTDTWNKVPNSNSVSAVTVLPNDSIIGVGMDKTLWSQSKLENFSKANANNSASTTKDSDPPWVLRSAASSYLPLAAQAEIWSDPKLFRRQSGQMTVQSRFLYQKGTTCRFEVQFNNVSNKPLDENVLVGRPGKAAVSQYDHLISIKLKPGASYAFGTEVRECPPNWGETKDMEKCAACEPIVYFTAP